MCVVIRFFDQRCELKANLTVNMNIAIRAKCVVSHKFTTLIQLSMLGDVFDESQIYPCQFPNLVLRKKKGIFRKNGGSACECTI